METLNIPQVFAEISQFFSFYGPLISEILLIFFVIAVGIMIKAGPPELSSQDDNETPLS